MKIIIEDTYRDMSQVAANILLSKMYLNRRVNLSITAGATPKLVYELMVPQVKGRKYLDNVYYYNFDEIPINGEELGVTLRNLYAMYFEPANIAQSNIIGLNHHNYTSHMQQIRKEGGLDLMLMGLGADGHYCGNLPHTTKFEDEIVSVPVDIRPDMYNILLKEVGGDESKVPELYITMGPRAVMETKELVMIVNGQHKAKAVKELVRGKIHNDFPSSILKLHPRFLLVLDRDAASLL
jgi:6-phosphogluconolactonase/glucosamine-6-phosphate isomerase/deaminase